MICVRNGKVHAAFILPASPGVKPHGLVLAETATDWVTWNIYWDGDLKFDDEGTDGGLTHELWEAECGHYFQKSMPESQGDPQRLAHYDFGLRLRRLLNIHQWAGVKQDGLD